MAWWDAENSSIRDRTHPWFRGYKPDRTSLRYEKMRNRRKMTMGEFQEQFRRAVQKRLREGKAGKPWDEWDLDRR